MTLFYKLLTNSYKCIPGHTVLFHVKFAYLLFIILFMNFAMEILLRLFMNLIFQLMNKFLEYFGFFILDIFYEPGPAVGLVHFLYPFPYSGQG